MNTSATKEPTRSFRRTAVPATTVAGYLLSRLAEAGVISVFGVPGDYNLGLLDAFAGRPSMAWIGMASELGAGYAADSYARLRGLGALVTTFGVGELSALTAVAGSYAESVPVVHIVGTPALAARRDGTPLHHNLPGAGFDQFVPMAAAITAARADLRPDNAGAEIDRVITTALRESRPVYLAIPADVGGASIPAPAGPLRRDRRVEPPTPETLRAFTSHATRLLDNASTAAVLVGHLPARYQASAAAAALASAADLPVAVLSMAKGDISEAGPRFAGLYAGAASAKATRLAVEDSDVLITVGVTLADTVTGVGTYRLPVAGRIDLAADHASIGAVTYPGLDLRTALAALTRVVGASHVHSRPDFLGIQATEADDQRATAASAAGPLSQQQLWGSVQDFVAPGDLIIADQGTAFYGAAGLTLPERSRLIGQPSWASIGWALPAAIGASLAAPDRRVILIAGDGAMQQTAAELGILFAQGLAPVIIVLNNHGYATERAISHPQAGYHQIPAWNWTALPATVGPAASAVALHASTSRELARVLCAANNHTAAGRPVLIEAILGADDLPPLLRDLTRVLAARGGDAHDD
jgi:TPP-dependent 2-oxoacid decarboxylase